FRSRRTLALINQSYIWHNDAVVKLISPSAEPALDPQDETVRVDLPDEEDVDPSLRDEVRYLTLTQQYWRLYCHRQFSVGQASSLRNDWAEFSSTVSGRRDGLYRDESAFNTILAGLLVLRLRTASDAERQAARATAIHELEVFAHAHPDSYL